MTFLRLPLRVLGKLYGLLLQLLTPIRAGGSGDPTGLLLKQFTEAQHRAAMTARVREENPSARKLRLLIVIPFRDRWDITAGCLTSLECQRRGQIELKVVLVDNGSTDPVTHKGLTNWVKKSEGDFQISHLPVDEKFNFSRLNNVAIQTFAPAFAPDFLLFLNNDVELTGESFLEDLLSAAKSLPRAGAVGTTLCFPDGRIQHLFAAPGVKLVAAHPLKGRQIARDAVWFKEPRPVAATTGALMLVRWGVFQEVGGFDENFPTLGQDIDLCLKLQKVGFTNWVVPWLWATHHESASRGEDLDRSQIEAMYLKWGSFLTKNPFYAESFSRWSEPPVLTLGWEPAFPWRLLV